jgi:hypothetical protein
LRRWRENDERIARFRRRRHAQARATGQPGGVMVHCWQGKREHTEFGSQEWHDTFLDDGDGTCMLDDGHDGPHEFTPDSQIIVQFLDAPAPEEKGKLTP